MGIDNKSVLVETPSIVNASYLLAFPWLTPRMGFDRYGLWPTWRRFARTTWFFSHRSIPYKNSRVSLLLRRHLLPSLRSKVLSVSWRLIRVMSASPPVRFSRIHYIRLDYITKLLHIVLLWILHDFLPQM